LLLLIACLVVGGAILLFEADQEDQEEDPTLLELSRGAVDALTVVTERDTVRVAKRGNSWMVEYPLVDRANPKVVDALISDLETVRGTRSFPADEGLSTYGLDPPQVRVVAHESAIKDARFSLGKTTPAGSFRYAQIGDTAVVHLVDEGFKNRLGKALDDLRSRALLAVSSAEIDTVVQVVNDRETKLIRDDQTWNLASPWVTRADEDEVSSFLRTLGDPVIEEYRPLSAGIRESPRAVWQFRSSAGTRAETLWVGESMESQLLVQSSTRAYDLVVDTSLVASLLAPPARWRSRQLLPFYSYKANELTIEKPGQEPLVFRKDQDGPWHVGEWIADSDKVMELVRQLEDCRVEGFTEDDADTLREWNLLLTIGTRDFETALVEFGPLRDGRRTVFARHLGSPALASCVEPDSISLEPLDWRDRKLVSFYPYQVKEVRITAGAREALARQKNYGEWKQSGPWADDLSIDDFLETIHEARIALFAEDLPELPELGDETSIFLKRDDRKDLEIRLYTLGPDSMAAIVGEGAVCILKPGLEESIRGALKNP
jgi:hypothetical protein